MAFLFVGTYTSNGSRGIYAVPFDEATGALGEPRLAAETGNPTFLALSPDRRLLYAVHNSRALAVGYAVDGARGALAPLPAAAAETTKEPCHIAVDPAGRCVVVSHYHEGYAAALPLAGDGRIAGPAASIVRHAGPPARVVPGRQERPHVHCATIAPDGRFALVCDLGLDRIFSYPLDAARAQLGPEASAVLATAPGMGPRQTVFAPDGRHVFAIGELDNTVAAYAYDAANGALAWRDTRATLPADYSGKNTAAAVRVHPNGRFVYGSNRGHDSVAVLAFDAAGGRLTPVEIVSCGGREPRDMELSADGRWLVVARQASDSLAVFRVDAATGRLTQVATGARVATPVCVVFAA